MTNDVRLIRALGADSREQNCGRTRILFAGYVRTHVGRIPDNAARRAAGQTIGSGAVKKGVKIVVNRRLQGRRGMRWWRERAVGVIALRLAILNDE